MLLSSLVCDAITNYHRLSGVKKNFCSHNSQGKVSRLRCQHCQFLVTALFLACGRFPPRSDFIQCGEGENSSPVSLLIRELISSRTPSPPLPIAFDKLNYLPNVPDPNTITLGVKASTYKFWAGGGHNLVHNNYVC